MSYSTHATARRCVCGNARGALPPSFCVTPATTAQHCWSDYWWGVVLPVELHPLGGAEAGAASQLSITLRAAGGAFDETLLLSERFAAGLLIPCSVDPASGAVSVSENATAPGVVAEPQGRAEARPWGVLFVHAVWCAHPQH